MSYDQLKDLEETLLNLVFDAAQAVDAWHNLSGIADLTRALLDVHAEITKLEERM